MRSMKKVAVGLLIALLVLPLLAAPAEARWRHHHRGHGGFFIGLGIGALLTAPFWYRPAYAYPVYTPAPVYTPYPVYYPAPVYIPPAYSAPAYTPTYPTPEPVSPAPPGGTPPGATPQSESQPPATPPAPTTAQSCQTVWVEGHYETRVMANGQRFTSWVPAHTQQLCQ